MGLNTTGLEKGTFPFRDESGGNIDNEDKSGYRENRSR